MRTAAATSRSWRGRSLVLVMLLVTAALGFCVFDGHDHDGQGPALDLCVVVLNVSFASALICGLLLEGWAADRPTVPVRSAWTTVLAPPPRSL
jgi:hypothetical protein